MSVQNYLKVVGDSFQKKPNDIEDDIINLSNLLEEQILFVERMREEHGATMTMGAQINVSSEKFDKLRSYYKASGKNLFSIRKSYAHILITRGGLYMITLNRQEKKDLEEFYFQRALLNPNEKFAYLREIKKLKEIKKNENK
jgi:hypothetical protein